MVVGGISPKPCSSSMVASGIVEGVRSIPTDLLVSIVSTHFLIPSDAHQGFNSWGCIKNGVNQEYTQFSRDHYTTDVSNAMILLIVGGADLFIHLFLMF